MPRRRPVVRPAEGREEGATTPGTSSARESGGTRRRRFCAGSHLALVNGAFRAVECPGVDLHGPLIEVMEPDGAVVTAYRVPAPEEAERPKARRAAARQPVTSVEVKQRGL